MYVLNRFLNLIGEIDHCKIFTMFPMFIGDESEKRVVDVVAYCSLGYRSSDLVTKLLHLTKQLKKERAEKGHTR